MFEIKQPLPKANSSTSSIIQSEESLNYDYFNEDEFRETVPESMEYDSDGFREKRPLYTF
jgi:hypothetical protein